MPGKSHSLLVAVGVASVATWMIAPGTPVAIQAATTDVLADTDGDFLPDVVEWAVLTSATHADTDGDFVPDFIEVVQRGAPRQASFSLAVDHEMRVVVTAPPCGSPDQTSWLHLFVRFASAQTPVSGFGVWFETPLVPGLQLPLDGLFAGEMVVRERSTPEDGQWLQVSVPMAATSFLQALTPCSIHAAATLGGRNLHTAVNLIDVQGTVASILPFGNGRFAIQSIAPPVNAANLSNKVCLLDLAEVGSGPGGTVYEVVDADCEDCNELECGVSCPQSVGWILTIPGGIDVLTGG